MADTKGLAVKPMRDTLRQDDEVDYHPRYEESSENSDDTQIQEIGQISAWALSVSDACTQNSNIQVAV